MAVPGQERARRAWRREGLTQLVITRIAFGVSCSRALQWSGPHIFSPCVASKLFRTSRMPLRDLSFLKFISISAVANNGSRTVIVTCAAHVSYKEARTPAERKRRRCTSCIRGAVPASHGLRLLFRLKAHIPIWAFLLWNVRKKEIEWGL